MADEKGKTQNPASPPGDISAAAARIMAELSRQFPVCMASDEFHYFPQARAHHPDWSRWDDFSEESIAEMKARAENWRKRLAHCRGADPDPSAAIDAELLQRALQTLVEQLTIASPWRVQPTFYLTIMGIGLSEALDHGSRAWFFRLRGLPGFIRQARRNLRMVPRRFGRMGLEMLSRQIAWLESMAPPRDLLQPVLGALSELETFLRESREIKAYLPDVALYERIAYAHMGCELNTDEIAAALEREIDESLEILTREAERLAPGRPWQKVVDGLPPPEAIPGGVHENYRQAIDQLSRHCVDQGLLSPGAAGAWPVKVEIIPDYMRPVRANAAFSAPPAHPPRGGTFYIQAAEGPCAPPTDYRLLTAHETNPGHVRPRRSGNSHAPAHSGPSRRPAVRFRHGSRAGPGDRPISAPPRKSPRPFDAESTGFSPPGSNWISITPCCTRWSVSDTIYLIL